MNVSPHNIVTVNKVNQYHIGTFFGIGLPQILFVFAKSTLHVKFWPQMLLLAVSNAAKSCGFGLNGRFVD